MKFGLYIIRILTNGCNRSPVPTMDCMLVVQPASRSSRPHPNLPVHPTYLPQTLLVVLPVMASHDAHDLRPKFSKQPRTYTPTAVLHFNLIEPDDTATISPPCAPTLRPDVRCVSSPLACPATYLSKPCTTSCASRPSRSQPALNGRDPSSTSQNTALVLSIP